MKIIRTLEFAAVDHGLTDANLVARLHDIFHNGESLIGSSIKLPESTPVSLSMSDDTCCRNCGSIKSSGDFDLRALVTDVGGGKTKVESGCLCAKCGFAGYSHHVISLVSPGLVQVRCRDESGWGFYLMNFNPGIIDVIKSLLCSMRESFLKAYNNKRNKQ